VVNLQASYLKARRTDHRPLAVIRPREL